MSLSGSSSHGDSEAAKRDPFTLQVALDAQVPILVAVPHAGRDYPAEITARMRRPDYSALKLEDRLVDLLAVEISRQTGAGLLVSNVPRAVIDLNRSTDDVDWTMIAEGAPPRFRHSLANRRSRSGLGLVPRRLQGLGEIWRDRITRGELQRRIAQVHRPYHEALAGELERLRDRWGAALLVDLHSMPPLARRHPGERSPEFVIGDRFGSSCNAMLSARALNHLSSQQRAVAHNRPYAGGYVLERHGAPSRGLHAMQFEVCRSIYLDSAMEQPSARLPAVARLLAGTVRALANEVVALGRGSAGLAQAAE